MATAVLVAPMIGGTTASAAGGTDVYDAIGDAVPPNVASVGYQATSTQEFGDLVALGAGSRSLVSVTVEMSSWGCESGSWNVGGCLTTPGATFTHPLTLTLYKVDESVSPALPGDVIVSQTTSFAIPYRPSADPTCADPKKWKASDGNCYNGFATPVTFTFPSGTVLPEELIWGMAYNTSTHGYNPIGTSTPCFSSPQGCGYDSLNVGADSLPGQPSAGVDVDPDVAYLNTSHAPFYTDGGAGGTNTFRADTGWAANRPMARITTTSVFGFSGFFNPVNNDQVNLAKAGQTIPVKWQLTDGGSPVSDPASFVSLTSKQYACGTSDVIGVDAIESYTNASGLLYQGDGNWQFNWKTPKAYAGQCRVMTVTLSDGTTHAAYFQFK